MGHDSTPSKQLVRTQSLTLFVTAAAGFLLLLSALAMALPYTNPFYTVRLKIAIPSAATIFKGRDAVRVEGAPAPDQQGAGECETPTCDAKSCHCQNAERLEASAASPTVLASPPKVGGDDGRAQVLVPNTYEREALCNTSYRRTVVCHMAGDVKIHGKSSTIFTISANSTTHAWQVKPYARKKDSGAMTHVHQLTIAQLQASPLLCQVNHTVPALVFSTGGYLGNVFHDFVDVLVPLFATSRVYSGEVQFLVTNLKPWWITKYKPILDRLTHYDILNLDGDDTVRCFPQATVGLRRHDTKEFSLDLFPPSGAGESLKDFSKFLRSAFLLRRSAATTGVALKGSKPRLLILTRKRTRKFANIKQIANAAKKMGFEVVKSEAIGTVEFARVVNSCDAMLGVHGAGLTNEVFLPEGAVVIQVVPLGDLLWWSRGCYGEPAAEMGLRYLEYEIAVEESTLVDLYPKNHTVFTDPGVYFRKGGWKGFGEVFLDKQDVRVDVKRFTGVLSKAMDILRQ